MVPWHGKIDGVTSHEALLELARDYLDTWSAGDLALVPEACRPTRIKGVDDLHYWHQCLVDAYCAGAIADRGGEHVRDLLAFFVFAVQRAIDLPRGEAHFAAATLFSEKSVPRLFASQAREGD